MTEQKFISQEELDFIRNLNHELLEEITGQEIEYYAVNETKTEINDLYGESVSGKVFFNPIKIKCLVFFQEPIIQTTQFGQDVQYSIEVYIHKRTLNEHKNLRIIEGDIIKHGTIFYEIVSVSEPQLLWGRIENRMMILAKCKVARADEHGLINTEEYGQLF